MTLSQRARQVGRWKPGTVITVLVLAVVCFVWIYPFLWMISASLKDNTEIFAAGMQLWPEAWRFENYSNAWFDIGFSKYMFNSIFVTVIAVSLVLIKTSMAGYVLGRHSFIGKRLLYGVLIATLLIPEGYTIIPVVELVFNLGLMNSRWGMILALAGGGHVIYVLLFSSYFSRIPKELEEAAVIDGAGPVRLFFQVMLPIAKPVIASVAILSSMVIWNAFFLPLVLTLSNPELRTLPVGILTAFESNYSYDWAGMSAAATMSLLPIVVLFFTLQRYFVEGIAGAVK